MSDVTITDIKSRQEDEAWDRELEKSWAGMT